MQQVELAPHQHKAVERLHNGSILCGGVGTGKSRVAMQYYKEKEAPRNVVVITTAKKRDSLDWESEAVLHGVGTSADSTLSGVLTVDSWNNLWKYVDVSDAFFIFDEQRLVGSGAWVGVFQKIAKKNHWILLSATPGDTWLDYIPVFVANGFYKNKTEFLREHVVYSRFSKFPKVDRYIAAGRLVRHRNALLVDMPYERHTTRVLNTIDVEYNKTLFDKVVKDRWHAYENRPLRDVAELYRVMRKVVNSDPSRLDSIRMLMEQHPKLIVFYNFDYELEILRSLAEPISLDSSSTLDTSSASGKSNSSKLSTKSRADTVSTSKLDELPSCYLSGLSCHCVMKEQTWCSFSESTKGDGPVRSQSYLRQLERIGSIETNTPSSLLIRESKIQKDGCAETMTIDQDTSTSETKSSNESEETTSGVIGAKPKTGSSTTTLREFPVPCVGSSIQDQQLGRGSTSAETKSNSSIASLRDVAVAEWNGHKHEEIPKTDRWVYLVQSNSGSEGWNCIETDTVVFYSLNYSYRTFEQCQGRIDRLNTMFTTLNYYILRSDSLIDKLIWKALSVKQNFNERKSEAKFTT
jgi:hypothetical protein